MTRATFTEGTNAEELIDEHLSICRQHLDDSHCKKLVQGLADTHRYIEMLKTLNAQNKRGK